MKGFSSTAPNSNMATLVSLRQMSISINIQVINKYTANERLRAIAANRYVQDRQKLIMF